MNDSRSYITLDFRNTHMPVVVKAKRGDTARTLYISLADGGTPYMIADGCYATFTARKPDRTAINNSCIIKKNMIVYPFTEQTCSAVGRMTAEICLYGSNGKMLTSASFILEIHRTVFGPNDIPASEDEMNALDALILDTTALKEEVERKLENGEFIGEQGPPGPEGKPGKGISQEAAQMLVTILQAALYGTNQSGNIRKLAEMLQSGGSSPDFPDDPDEPDIPEVKKLETPQIQLVTDDEPDVPIDPGEKTPAILGVAILGRTILGDYDNDLPKLAKPQIQLVTLADDAPKLETPQIQLVTEDAPDEPNPPKLTAPEIYLETVTEPKDPETPKLEKPEIYLETITSVDPPDPGYSGPDEPEMEQLATPEIYLETEVEPANISARIENGYVKWEKMDGVDTYIVAIDRPDGSRAYTFSLSGSMSAEVALSKASSDLDRGVTYTIIVTGYVGSVSSDPVCISNELSYTKP